MNLATESWLENRVPSAFMQDSIDAARKTFDQARQSVDRSDAAEPLRRKAGEELRAAQDASGELRGAIGRTDRPAAMRARLRFASAYQALHALERQVPP